MRRFLSALMLVAAVLAAATSALASPAQAAASPGPGSFGIRLVDVPSAEADNPRALRYIIDHLGPGTTIHRRILVENLGPRAARIIVYPDAATISGGSFIGDAGETRSDLTTLDHHEPARRGPRPARKHDGHRDHPRAAGRFQRGTVRRDLGAGNQPPAVSERSRRHGDQPRRRPDLPVGRPRRGAAVELRRHIALPRPGPPTASPLS